jgi:predicted transcriptional regulator of viral defense system
MAQLRFRKNIPLFLNACLTILRHARLAARVLGGAGIYTSSVQYVGNCNRALEVVRITHKGKTDEANAAMISVLDALPRRVHQRRDLEILFQKNRQRWHLLASSSSTDLLEYLQTLHLKAIRLIGPGHSQERARYAWREPSAFDVAQSLQKSAYISHASAASLHGLLDQPPKTVYVNIEQSPKPSSSGDLSQEGIDRAFKGKQRQSAMSYSFQDAQIVVLNGKHTGRLGVMEIEGPSGGIVDITNIERTLIDLAVRPAYGGGAARVLEAFQRAKKTASIRKLQATLRSLDYVYPYHQAIGFYLDRAGFDTRETERFRKLGLKFDFYLSHNIRHRAYDAKWRVHYPKELQQ